jgi:hypothetical protein
MIKISFAALCRILIENNHIFTIEKAITQPYKNKLAYKLMVGIDYPLSKTLVYPNNQDGEGIDAARTECMIPSRGKVIVLYETERNVVLGMSTSVQTLISEAKRKAINALASTNIQEKAKVGDEFGRQIRTDT